MWLVSRQLKRDRATNLAVFPNTTFPPNFPHVKGEGESEQVNRKLSDKRWSGCSVNLLVSLVGFSCHKLWQRRCWLQQGFSSKTSHLLNIEHLHSLSTQTAHWHRFGWESTIHPEDLRVYLQGVIYLKHLYDWHLVIRMRRTLDGYCQRWRSTLAGDRGKRGGSWS